MCATLGAMSAFTVTSDAVTEIILTDGRKVHLVATTSGTVDRAAGFRLRRQGPFGATETVHDGTTLTVWSEALGGYAAVPSPGGVDEGLDTLLALFGEDAAGGADLLYADPCGTLMNGVEEGAYMGLTTVAGQTAHHLFYRAADHDWQIWVLDGDRALPVRYVITAKWVMGAPQFTAQFHGWSVGTTGDFAFVPPEGARAVDPAELQGEAWE